MGTIKSRYNVFSLVFIVLVAMVCLPINVAHATVQNIAVTKLIDDPDHKKTLFVITTDENTYHIIVEANITKAGNETLIQLSATLFNPQNETITASATIPDTLTDHPYGPSTVPAIHIHFPEDVDEYLVYYILPIATVIAIVAQIYEILENMYDYLFDVAINNAPFVWASIPWVLRTLLIADSNNDDTGTHTPFGYPTDYYHLGSFDLYIPISIWDISQVFNDRYFVATSKSWWEIAEQEFATDIPWWWFDHGVYHIVWFTYYTAQWISSRVHVQPPNIPPSALFSWRPIQPTVNETIVFTSTSFDPDGTITNYQWWMGEGNQRTAQNFTYVYHSAGDYNVTLKVTDNSGSTDNVTQTVTVKPAPLVQLRAIPDHLEIDIQKGQYADGQFLVGESLNQTDLQAVAFQTSDFPENGNYMYYTISSGNVTFDKNGIGTISKGTYQNVTATFHAPADTPIGWYTGNMTIISANGGNATIFIYLYVFGPPVANFVWSPPVPRVGESVTFDASSSIPGGRPIVDYEWNFGDGQTASGQTTTHSYASATIYSVTINVTDSNGLWDIEQKQVQVVQPHSPKAEFTVFPETANIGELVKFDATTSQQGWNGTNQMPITKYSWDFGDGNKTDTTTPTIYHAFSSSGIYYPTLTVYASGGTPETDSITHRVVVMSVPVGGYSISLTQRNTSMASSVYLALLIMLSAVFTTVRRKTRREKTTSM